MHETIQAQLQEILEDYASRSKILGEFAVFISAKNVKVSKEPSDN